MQVKTVGTYRDCIERFEEEVMLNRVKELLAETENNEEGQGVYIGGGALVIILIVILLILLL